MTRLASFLALTAVLVTGCRATIELDPGTLLVTCRPVGSACAEASECCSGACDSFCTALPGCSPAGESCATGPDCCSYVCASDGQGRVVCQQLGGCRVAGELCTRDLDCCGGNTCAGIQAATGIGRCAPLAACAGAGEICRASMSPSAMRECCEGAVTHTQCRASDVHGIDRCVAAAADCAVEGGPCSAPSDCCGGRCVRDEAGVLSCLEACIGGLGRCTADADCCSAACGSDSHCASVPRSCAAIAEECEADAECCSGLCDFGVCSSPLF